MKLKSDDKKLNQYLIHAEIIKSVEAGDDYEIYEIKRGLDQGLALISEGKVIESYMEDRNRWAKMVKEDSSHIEYIKSNFWMFFN